MAHETSLQVGQAAPAFTGLDENGKERKLTDYAGKKLLLFFYPKDNTPGCTTEACDLRNNYDQLKNEGFELLGVSPDSAKKHQRFIEKHELPFPLLADENLEVIKAYDVWGKKKFMGREYEGLIRTTFIIDEDGNIAHVIKKVKTKAHAQQVMDLMKD